MTTAAVAPSTAAMESPVHEPLEHLPGEETCRGEPANSAAGDDAMAAGILSSTREPHHLPGYAGFVPGLKFKGGQSFSTITGKLLRDESVSGSPWMVLTNFQKTRPYEETDLIRHRLLKERERSLNRDIYHEHMGVPGYTGHIPQQSQQYGGTYATTSFYGLSDFANIQKKVKRDAAILRSINHGPLEQQDMFAHVNTQVPMYPINKEAAPFRSKQLLPYLVSPYVMAKDDPQKYYMAGYTGYVPRRRFQSGNTYTRATHDSLCEFNDITCRNQALKGTPVIVFPELKPARQFHDIYPKDDRATSSGMTPFYTGAVPGSRYKVGISFANASKGVRKTLRQNQ